MDAEKKRLLWGAGLAWVPALMVMVPTIMNGFRGASQEKATGLAVVAGGMLEALVTFGLVAFVACQLGAIVALAREIRRGGVGRTAFCMASMGFSLVMLTVMLLTVWWWWHLAPVTSGTGLGADGFVALPGIGRGRVELRGWGVGGSR